MSQRLALVHQFPLFSGISAGDCADVLSAAHEHYFSRRQTILREGDPVQQISLLTSGSVKITQFGQNGSEVILRLGRPGELLGALGLCSGGTHCSTAEALQLSKALVWEAAIFESVLDSFPILRRNIGRILGECLRELEDRFHEMSTKKVGSRLSSQLVRLLNQIGCTVNGDVEIGLSREELAQLTGMTLFTVSRLICQWEQQGIVCARRKAVLVRNLPALIKLSESD